MKIALTGTPGTGKTSAAARLSDITVIDLRKLSQENAERFVFDQDHDCLEIDLTELQALIPEVSGNAIIEGHLSHLLENDLVIILRCSPKVLAERLSIRNWPPEKIKENQEAEAVDVIMIEAMESDHEVLEVDTTSLSPAEVADAIEDIIAGERNKYKPGNIDWSSEVMEWF